MKDYTASKEPVFSEKIKIVETTDPVHADHANAAAKQLIENDMALKKSLDRKVEAEDGKGLSADYIDQDKKAVDGLNGLSFGQDEEGSWGYKAPGSQVLVPFGADGDKEDKHGRD